MLYWKLHTKQADKKIFICMKDFYISLFGADVLFENILFGFCSHHQHSVKAAKKCTETLQYIVLPMGRVRLHANWLTDGKQLGHVSDNT